jgi:Tfp pilus assembly protein PilE
MYNFVRFCATFFSWISWGWNEIVAYLRRRQGYFRIDPENPGDREHLLPSQQPIPQPSPTLFTHIKNTTLSWYRSTRDWWFGKRNSNPHIPMYRTQNESFFRDSYNSHIQEKKEHEERLFEQQLSQLCAESTFSFGSPPPAQNSYYSFNFNNNQYSQPQLDDQYFKKTPDAYESVALYPPDHSSRYFSSIAADPMLSSSIFHPIPLDSVHTANPQQTGNSSTETHPNVRSSLLMNSEFIEKQYNRDNTIHENITSTIQNPSVINTKTNPKQQNTNNNASGLFQINESIDCSTNSGITKGTENSDDDINMNNIANDIIEKADQIGHTNTKPIVIKSQNPQPIPKEYKNLSQSFAPKGRHNRLQDSFDNELERNPYI